MIILKGLGLSQCLFLSSGNDILSVMKVIQGYWCLTPLHGKRAIRSGHRMELRSIGKEIESGIGN